MAEHHVTVIFDQDKDVYIFRFETQSTSDHGQSLQGRETSEVPSSETTGQAEYIYPAHIGWEDTKLGSLSATEFDLRSHICEELIIPRDGTLTTRSRLERHLESRRTGDYTTKGYKVDLSTIADHRSEQAWLDEFEKVKKERKMPSNVAVAVFLIESLASRPSGTSK